MIQSGKCKIYHPTEGLIIQTDMTSNRMFIFLASPQPNKSQRVKEVCLQAATQDMARLWHRRFGHLSQRGFKTLQLKKMVSDMPKLPDCSTVCIDCLKGKQHRDPVSRKSTWRASEKLELIHADLCGPITPISNSSKMYLICFIADFCRKA